MSQGDEMAKARENEYRSDPRSSEELLQLAFRYAVDIDESDDLYWNPIGVLQHRLPDIFQQLISLLDSFDPYQREVAATVLGQNGVREKVLKKECARVLGQMLTAEMNTSVLTSALFALGHLKETESIECVLPLARHTDADVRYAATSALGGLEDDRAIKALILLSRDSNPDVRDWATFDLGTLIESDTPEIRTAFADRLSDTDADTRAEAIAGLVLREDPRVIDVILREIESWGDDGPDDWYYWGTAINALLHRSKNLPQEWHPLLEKMKKFNLDKGHNGEF